MIKKLLQHQYIKSLVLWLQQTVFFKGTVSLYDILLNVVHSNRKYDIGQRASSVAFSFTLASFPAIIFLFTLIPYIPIEHLDDEIMQFLQGIMPKGVFRDVRHTIEDIVSRPRSDVLSFGFIFTAIAATNGMLALMNAFDVIDEENGERGLVQKRGVAALLTILLVAVVFIAVIFFVVGDALMNLLGDWGLMPSNSILLLLNSVRYLISFCSIMLAVSIIYRFAPTNGRSFSFWNSGSMIATGLIVGSTYAFSFYLSNFSSYNKLYGSLGTLIAMMVWLYLLSFSLILGFEINASIVSIRFRAKP